MKEEKTTIVKALVIDDNEINNLILTNMLERFEIQVEQANQGIKALQMCRNKFYDIIFIDYIMPEMDGIQTTAALRKLPSFSQSSVVIALTSNNTEQIKEKYITAGANDVFVKPLELFELVAILKKWYPNVRSDVVRFNHEISNSGKNYEYIKTLIENSNDIDYSAAAKYITGNPVQFINILEAALKDLQSCINIIVNCHKINSDAQLQMGVHKLKNILPDIGALALLDRVKSFERLILHEDLSRINNEFKQFINDLEHFYDRLCNLLEDYYILKQSAQKENSTEAIMSEEEYEQSLLNAIYYIRRYEYDFTVRELERLILRGRPELKFEFEMVLNDIKNFKYEKALICMIAIKKRKAIRNSLRII